MNDTIDLPRQQQDIGESAPPPDPRDNPRRDHGTHATRLPPATFSAKIGPRSSDSPRLPTHQGPRMPELRPRPDPKDDAQDDLQDIRGLDTLLRDIAGGSRNAFETLYRTTASRLFGICLRVLGDRAEAEDVVQEVYTTIWHKAHQFDAERASAMAWLSMIARNRAIDRLRAAPARGTLAPMEWADDVPDAGATPLQSAMSDDDRARLEACMRQLDARRQALIRAAFFEGSTYEELARRISSPLGSVKSWIRRGLLQLRGCLEA
jgi:RNA polymerase sigma-70 factor (ECF subfamily)